MTNYGKSWLYTVGSALLMGLSAYYQWRLHDPAGPGDGYFALHRVMLVLSFVLIGVAVYAYMAYARRSRRHGRDRLLLLLSGLGLLAMTLVIWIGFGGVQEPFDAAGYTAVNLQIVTMTLLPVPFWIRGLVLACSHGVEDRRQRRVGKVISLIAALLMVVLIATGGMMRLMYYEG